MKIAYLYFASKLACLHWKFYVFTLFYTLDMETERSCLLKMCTIIYVSGVYILIDLHKTIMNIILLDIY